MIILKHLSSGNVTIYPKGLLPDHSYEVGYESHRARPPAPARTSWPTVSR